MARSASILSLSTELLREILDYIEPDPNKLVSLDRRGYLSQESFAPPPYAVSDQVEDIGNIRLVCQRFSQLGAVHQFARISTRFSKAGFDRLEKISKHPHLTKHVRKFSYMVPDFFVEGMIHAQWNLPHSNKLSRIGRAQIREILPDLDYSLGALDAQNFDKKATEQRRIIQSQRDLKVLQAAAGAFTGLQHVQILRLQDEEDAVLSKHLLQHSELSQFVQLNWAPAYTHSTMTLARALIAGRSPCSRFSTPMASPQSTDSLPFEPSSVFYDVAKNLTSLELHFDDGFELDRRMSEMSPLFKHVFEAAVNMQSIHIGFPSHRPISLGLEDIFHGVKWERLSAFGIQAWKLDEEEILELVSRHRERLRGLRLRDVLLNEGSSWKNVLRFLRYDLRHLEWVSLRRIGYTKKFDEQWLGAEIPDDPPGGVSDSDEDGDLEDDEELDRRSQHSADDVDQANLYLAGPSRSHDTENDSVQLSDQEEEDSDEEDTDDEQDYEMDFPRIRPETPDSAPWCSCNGRRPSRDNVEILGDNGVSVTNEQRRRWERWVTRRCAEHQRRDQ